jgi:hypothetical protein
LVALIKDNPILQGKNFRRHSKHFVAELHLLATLKFFGAEGNLGSNKRLRDNLGMGKGTVSNYVNRGILAILSLHDQCFFWPSAQERRDISLRIEQKFTLKNCVGMIDGTHLNLNTRPECCGEEYYTRKNCYAISALLIVDDNKCIRYANVGWPGSVHDNRIWSNTKIIHEPYNYFSASEYIIGDTAFTNSLILVTSYKRASGQAYLSAGQSWFNEKINSPRSGVENAIGIWKGRFPWLRNIRMRVQNKKSMVKIIKYIYATIILHNLCIKTPYQEDWLVDEDDDAEDEGIMNDGLNYVINPDVDDTQRRASVHNYLYRKLT